MNFRTIRTVLYLGGFLLTTTPKRMELRKLAETDPIEASRISHTYIKKAVKHILDISGSTLTVHGLEHIPEATVLYAGNHLSFFDIVAVETALPEEACAGFIAKASLEKIPGLRGWMHLVRCLSLDRSNMKEGLKTIFKGAEYLKEGSNMFIFPEGTRCKEGHLGEFKGASLKMAQKAKVPVVPVAITGTAAILEDNPGLSIRPSHVTVTFAEPLMISDLPRPEQKNAVEMVKQTIADCIAEVRENQA